MNNILTLVDTKPALLQRIRHLSRQGLTRTQILEQLRLEGHQISKDTLYRTTRSYGIPVQHTYQGRKS